MCAKGAQRNKNKATHRGKNQHKTAGHVSVLKLCASCAQKKVLLVPKAEFFLLVGRLCQDPLAKRGYFTQFCLTVMTNQIKSVLTDQNIIKGADQAAGLNFGLRHDVVSQRHALSVDGSL